MTDAILQRRAAIRKIILANIEESRRPQAEKIFGIYGTQSGEERSQVLAAVQEKQERFEKSLAFDLEKFLEQTNDRDAQRFYRLAQKQGLERHFAKALQGASEDALARVTGNIGIEEREALQSEMKNAASHEEILQARWALEGFLTTLAKDGKIENPSAEEIF